MTVLSLDLFQGGASYFNANIHLKLPCKLKKKNGMK